MLPSLVILVSQPLDSGPRSALFSPFLCFHKLANCPSHWIDLEIHCFHALASCYFRKCFVFTSIPVAGCVSPSAHGAFCVPARPQAGLCGNVSVLSSLRPLLPSWLSFSRTRRLFSAACSLFCQSAGGGVAPTSRIARAFRSMYPDQL